MCGIVGYIGKNQAAPILLEGLSKLEYRGYDSAGIAVYNNNELEVAKSKGKLAVLSEKIDGGKKLGGNMGIGLADIRITTLQFLIEIPAVKKAFCPKRQQIMFFSFRVIILAFIQ